MQAIQWLWGTKTLPFCIVLIPAVMRFKELVLPLAGVVFDDS